MYIEVNTLFMYLCIDRQSGGGGQKEYYLEIFIIEISMSFNFQELIGID